MCSTVSITMEIDARIADGAPGNVVRERLSRGKVRLGGGGSNAIRRQVDARGVEVAIEGTFCRLKDF
jgi:hypothetical protein